MFTITCVEVEFSLVCEDIVSDGVLEGCSRCNIPIVAYSPLGRGLLTDYTVDNADTFLSLLYEDVFRRRFDKFNPENCEHSMKLLKELYKFAHTKKNTSLESLSLSWILKISQPTDFEGIRSD